MFFLNRMWADDCIFNNINNPETLMKMTKPLLVVAILLVCGANLICPKPKGCRGRQPAGRNQGIGKRF